MPYMPTMRELATMTHADFATIGYKPRGTILWPGNDQNYMSPIIDMYVHTVVDKSSQDTLLKGF